MQLIYIDESGNSGTNLSDPQQPVFVLGALLIPEVSWKSLVEATEVLLKPMEKFFGNEFELHTHKLINGNGKWRDIPINDRLDLIDQLMSLLSLHRTKFIYQFIVKKQFARWVDKQYGGAAVLNPHVAAFPRLAADINRSLQNGKSSDLGILICDDNREVHLDIETSLRLLQRDPGSLRLDRIIEKGFFIDSRKCIPLQLVDICVYYARKTEERLIGASTRKIDDAPIEALNKLTADREKEDPTFDLFEWGGLETHYSKIKGAARIPREGGSGR